jgi:RNA polymerase sigma-70 factor (ECF subfamily)
MKDDTCWTIIRSAARGDTGARDRFARLYQDTLRAYLGARWQRGPLSQELDDAVQDVFVECFKDGGALARLDADRAGGFRAFLYGVARNVARRREERDAKTRQRRPEESAHPSRMASPDTALSRVFDRAWARAIMREAAARQRRHAETVDEAAQQRVELLRLRFHDGRPIREIAERWGVDAAHLHHEYARARAEFRVALEEVVAFHHPGSRAEVQAECATLLGLLG